MNTELLAAIEAEILGWPGVEKETREDGIVGAGEATIYTLGRRQIVHIHHDGVADIEFPRERFGTTSSPPEEPNRTGVGPRGS